MPGSSTPSMKRKDSMDVAPRRLSLLASKLGSISRRTKVQDKESTRKGETNTGVPNQQNGTPRRSSEIPTSHDDSSRNPSFSRGRSASSSLRGLYSRSRSSSMSTRNQVCPWETVTPDTTNTSPSPPKRASDPDIHKRRSSVPGSLKISTFRAKLRSNSNRRSSFTPLAEQESEMELERTPTLQLPLHISRDTSELEYLKRINREEIEEWRRKQEEGAKKGAEGGNRDRK